MELGLLHDVVVVAGRIRDERIGLGCAVAGGGADAEGAPAVCGRGEREPPGYPGITPEVAPERCLAPGHAAVRRTLDLADAGAAVPGEAVDLHVAVARNRGAGLGRDDQRVDADVGDRRRLLVFLRLEAARAEEALRHAVRRLHPEAREWLV